MKKTVFILISVIFMISGCGRAKENVDIKLFYVDSSLNRLLSYNDTIEVSDESEIAGAAVDKLIEGRDDTDGIRRLLPNKKGCVKVSVDGSVAYIDLSAEILENVPKSRDIERLIIYQLVNTVTSLKGIRFVRFTVDGTQQKDFMGFYDMREVYKYRYPEW